MPTVQFRRRGNPKWGQRRPMLPVLPTEFEKQVRQLRLSRDMYVHSAKLRTWCEENRNRCYIPEWLLETWGIQVDPSLDRVA